MCSGFQKFSSFQIFAQTLPARYGSSKDTDPQCFHLMPSMFTPSELNRSQVCHSLFSGGLVMRVRILLGLE